MQLTKNQRELEKKKNNLVNEQGVTQERERELNARGKTLRDKIQDHEKEIGALDSQEGKQMTKVQALSADAATAWKWIQEHQDEFEQEVYGPALVTCSIKDAKYTAVVEACLGKSDLLAFTAQTSADFYNLQSKLLSKHGLGLSDVTLRQVSETLADLNHPPLSAQQTQQSGLQGWAIDYIDGPEPVLAMLCDSRKINACGITLTDISEQQHNMLVDGRVFGWATSKHWYKVNRRAEYGPQATSTTSKAVRDPQFWTDAPVDSSAKREIEAKIEILKQDFQVSFCNTPID